MCEESKVANCSSQTRYISVTKRFLGKLGHIVHHIFAPSAPFCGYFCGPPLRFEISDSLEVSYVGNVTMKQ
jgi:hypothetical protein